MSMALSTETWVLTDSGDWLNLATGETTAPPGETTTMLIGAAMSDDPTYIEGYNADCGPITCTREYDFNQGLPNSILDLDRCAYNYNHQRATVFSFKWDHGALANGSYDDQINTFIANWPTDYPGIVLIDNEPDQVKKGLDPATFRAAVEHVVGTFGFQPRPEIRFGTALMQYTFRNNLEETAGSEWLPDVPELIIDIHVYGRQNHYPYSSMLEKFMRRMNERPGWTWGVGETNCEEKDGVPDSKAEWFTSAADFTFANGGQFWCTFDVIQDANLEEVRSSPQATAALKAIAEKYDAGPQGPGV